MYSMFSRSIFNCILLFIISFYSYRAFIDVEKSSNKIANEMMPMNAASDQIMKDLLNQEPGIRGYQLSKDNIFLESYYSGKKSMDKNLEILRTYSYQYTEIRMLIDREIVPQINAIQAYDSKQILNRQVNIPGNSLTQFAEGKERMDEYRNLQTDLNNKINRITEETLQKSKKSTDKVKELIWITGLVVLFVGVGLLSSVRLQFKFQKVSSLANTDGLTNIGNRRAFDTVFI